MATPPLNRRTFLLASGSVPAAALLSNTVRTQGALDNPEDMAAFGRLAGLKFSQPELEQAEQLLDRLRGNYTSLRQQEIAFELAPNTHFDPFPMDAKRSPATGAAAIQIPTNVALPATKQDLAFLSVLELASLLRQGKVTSRVLTSRSLQRLEKFDPQLLCVVTLLSESALKHADAMDRELAAGQDRGPLHGIPYGAKDLFAWPGAPTTFGAAPFNDHRWNVKATPLARLEAAGAVLCAKLSLGALAMGDLWYGGGEPESAHTHCSIYTIHRSEITRGGCFQIKKFDAEMCLDKSYRKHLDRHNNKLLLRIRMLFYIHSEILGEFQKKINKHMNAR